MKRCHFLEVRRGQKGEQTTYCGAGVNFYLLEERRHLCRTCPLNTLGDAPLCEYLQAYAFLESNPEGKEFVAMRFDCDLLDQPLDDLSVCMSCPHYQVARGHVPSTLALQVGG